MTYEDPSLSEFRGYFKAKEPGKRARAEAVADDPVSVGAPVKVILQQNLTLKVKEVK